MSPVSFGLDVMLAFLLIAVLVVGVRLNRRLATLRQGQEGFARAVGELDAAAARAEAGLAHLRVAAEESHDQLLVRIETARGLIAKLEAATSLAETAGGKLAAAQATVRPTPPSPAPASPTGRTVDAARPAPATAPPRRTDRLEEIKAAMDLRRRPAIEDDLFEEPPRRAGGRA
jgi:hypothetical protein